MGRNAKTRLKMDELTRGILSIKLLKACDCDINSAIYSFIPLLGKELEIYTHNLHNLPKILDSAMAVFTNQKLKFSKNTSYYMHIKKNQEKFINFFNNACELIKYEGLKKIEQNKVHATLSFISHIYFDTFIRPVQFFLPHSSICSGNWEFWDNIDFFAFKERQQNKEFNFNFREKILKSKVWNIKFDLNTFPMIVQRRLLKEKLLDKKLNPVAMIKAMVIKIGEMGRPFINYGTVDFSIRELFTYLGEKKYMRVDREAEFLRRLDDEIITFLKEFLLRGKNEIKMSF